MVISNPPQTFEAMSGQTQAGSPVGQRFSAANRRWVLFMVGLAITLNFMDRSIINFPGQPIKAELQLSDFQLGALGGPLGALTGVVAGGWVAQDFEWRTAFPLSAYRGSQWR